MSLKKGLQEKEIRVLSTITHRNIVKINDVYKDGNIIVILEEYSHGPSLEDYINITGPIINHEKFMDITKQLSAGLRYLHVKKKMLHRDLKPSNIMISMALDEDYVKLTDFDQAESIDDLCDKHFPTRGGIQYTHPIVLNNLVRNNSCSAGLQNEFYAIGSTMYFMLTGKVPFNYTIEICEDGEKIIVEDKTYRIRLALDGNHLDRFDQIQHDCLLEQRLHSDVDPTYHSILRSCLSMRRNNFSDLDPKEAHAIFSEMLSAMTIEKKVSLDLSLIKKLEYLCGTKQEDGQAMHTLLRDLIRNVKKNGRFERETEHEINMERGSDATMHVRCNEKYTLKAGPLECTVEEPYSIDCYGEWSPIWKEIYRSAVHLKHKDKDVLSAESILHAKRGNTFDGQMVLEPILWKIEKFPPV